MQGVTVSLTLTFVVMLALGFAIVNFSDHMHSSMIALPHILVQ